MRWWVVGSASANRLRRSAKDSATSRKVSRGASDSLSLGLLAVEALPRRLPRGHVPVGLKATSCLLPLAPDADEPELVWHADEAVRGPFASRKQAVSLRAKAYATTGGRPRD